MEKLKRVHLGENQTMSHVFVQVPYLDMKAGKDEHFFKTVYYPQVIHNVDNVASMSKPMVENNKLHLCVRSNCDCPNCH